MEIQYRRLSEITPYENNPRVNDDGVEAVAESIKAFGFKVPMVLDKDGVIICGHTRYKAAQKLGIDQVPCVIADDLTGKEAKAGEEYFKHILAPYKLGVIIRDKQAVDDEMKRLLQRWAKEPEDRYIIKTKKKKG